MTTIDDYSDFLGYDVVAQRRKSRDETNTSYYFKITIKQ